jgi:DNA polymerase (family 10)
MTNWDIALHLIDIKKILSLKGERRLASLYEKSAFSVAALERNIQSASDVLFLPDRIRNDISELLTTGETSFKKELENSIPKGLIMIGNLPEMRADTALKIYNELGVDSVSDLRRALNNKALRNRKGFGLRLEEQIRKSMFLYEKGKKDLTLFEGFSYGNSIRSMLIEAGVKRVEVAGSVRRGKEEVSDVNFVVGVSKDDGFVKSLIKKNISYKKILKETPHLIYLLDKRNIELKFLVVDEKYFYPALAYYTGSKAHNVKIREIAKVKGFTISKLGYIEYPFKSEQEFYSRLGLQYIPPELREGIGEIELSRRNLIPKLVQYDDIKGDLHMHTDFSDGTNSIYDMVEEAVFQGYDYIAVTDHSQSAKVSNGLSANRLLKEMKIIDKINTDNEISVLKGSELEIKKDGSLDYDETLLNSLDVRIGGMHTGFDDDKGISTNRLIKAISSGFIDIVAHPTGRLIPVRDGFSLDMEKIFTAAKRYGVALEVDVFPNRMDLSSNLARQAKNFGLEYFSIDSDAHNAGHLNFIKYGVKLLRRAGLQKKNIINTFEEGELRKWLSARKH